MKHSSPSPSDERIDQASAWCVYLADGRLSPNVRTKFDAWVSDPENARALSEVARTWESLDETRLAPDLIDMRRDALEAFQRSHATQWNRSAWRRHRTSFAIAASLLVVAVAATLWVSYMPRSYETGLGERRVVALPDGSKVSLDAQSRVDVRYARDRRELRLKQGRAKFEVKTDPLRPFSVNAADKIVVATGTEFSVELLARQVRVILYEGKVAVLAERPDNTLQPVQVKRPSEVFAPVPMPAASLTSGRELIAVVSEPVAQVKPVDPVRSLAWEAGQLAFSDEPLSVAVERMNRYTDRPLAIGDSTAAHMRISGVFAAGDTDAFIEGVTGIFPVRVQAMGDRRTFVSVR
jgi:transmembrane sensor